MDGLVKLTEELVKALVKNPDSVSVKAFDADEAGEITIQVIVASEDMGRVIGKAGKTANAIRTLVRASAYTLELPRLNVNFDAI